MRDAEDMRLDRFLNGPYKKAWAAGLAEAVPDEVWMARVREAVRQGSELPPKSELAAERRGLSRNRGLGRPGWPATPAWGRWVVGTVVAATLVAGTLPSWYAYTGLPRIHGIGQSQSRDPGSKSEDNNRSDFGLYPQPVDPRSLGPVHPEPPPGPGYKHPYIAPVEASLSAEGTNLSLTIKNVSSQTLLITLPQSAYVAGAGLDSGARVQLPTGWATQPLALDAGAETVLTTAVALLSAPGWYEVGLLDRVSFSPLPEKQKAIMPSAGWIVSQRGQAGETAGGTPGGTAGGTGRSDGPAGETGEQVPAGAIGPGSIRMFVAPAPGQAVNGEVVGAGQSARDGFTLIIDKVTFTDDYTTVAFTVKGNVPVPTGFGFGLQRAGRAVAEGALELGYKGVVGGLAGTVKFNPTLKGETQLQVVLRGLTTYGPTEIPGPWTVKVPVR